MRLPTIQGTIRRRVLANFRIDPAVMQKELPSRFRPKLYQGYAVAGICMIRLDHIRPKLMPKIAGISSENAAHRVAVLWDEDGSAREGGFISRRDTNSLPNLVLGGRIFPGEHHRSFFTVDESDQSVRLRMMSVDGAVSVEIEGRTAEKLVATLFSRL